MKNEVGFPFLDEILPSIKKTFNADQVAIEKNINTNLEKENLTR